MSTEDKILALETTQKLIRVRPRFHGREREVRRISVLKDPIHDWTTGNGPSQNIRAATRARFSVFIKGEQVDDRDFMKRVSRRQSNDLDNFEDEVWSLRAIAEPQYRFFGAFACSDWLIIMTMRSRRYLGTAPNAWHKEMDKVLRIWKTLFPELRPWSGTQFSHYVTVNSEHADERWEEH